MGAISVSGYILEDPGRGRRKTVFPSCIESRVSATTPSNAMFTLFTICDTMTSFFKIGDETRMNPSEASASILDSTTSISFCSMP